MKYMTSDQVKKHNTNNPVFYHTSGRGMVYKVYIQRLSLDRVTKDVNHVLVSNMDIECWATLAQLFQD